MKLISWTAAIAMVGLLAQPVLAQGLPPIKLAGVIATVGANEIDVTKADGTTVPVLLADKAFIAQTETISIDAIKPGSFVGTAATPSDGTNLKGLELHVFPESMRGAGEGVEAWDDGPTSSMTNGTLSKVVGTTDRTITVTYKGGEKTVTISPDTPVAAMEPADRTALVVGAHVLLRGTDDAAGKLTASVVMVGKGDNVPAI